MSKQITTEDKQRIFALYWGQIDMTEDSECEKDTVKATMIDEIAQRYAEAYHAAKLAEVAQGECFTEKDWYHITQNVQGGKAYLKNILKYLNKKSAAFAAAKVDDLTRRKESAMKVLNDLDLQELAKELKVGLGEDIASQVLPKVKDLQERMYTDEDVRKSFNAGYAFANNDSDIDFEKFINQLKESK